jgi:DNA-binding transcriptional LysR family regulator
LSLRQIEAFKAMIEMGSSARAADVLNISQPAMSKLLAHLEEDTGLKLFDRAGGRLRPTDRATRLYAEVDRVFAGLHLVERAVELIKREDQGHLVIGVMPALSGAIVQRVLMRFRHTYPNVYLSVMARSSLFIAERLRSRQIDVGLINADIEDADIVAEPLAGHPLMCILPPHHPLAARAILTPEDIGGEPMISFERTSYTGHFIEAAFAAIGFQPNVVIEATTAFTIGELVAAGAGIALVHPVHVHGIRERVALRPFLPEIAFNLVVCRRHDVRSPELVEAIIEVIRTEIGATIAEVLQSPGAEPATSRQS